MAVDYKDYYKILDMTRIVLQRYHSSSSYSEEEVTQLRRIRRLQHDLGVNLAGVEVILRLLKRLEGLQQELEQERNLKVPR